MKYSIDTLYWFWRLTRRARERNAHKPHGAVAITAGSDTGYVYKRDGVQYIVIDGSDSLVEWIKNFMWFRVGRRREALGFREPAVRFVAQIIRIVDADAPIVCIGFSRGGPIAKSIALDLQKLYYPIESVVQFGSPKLGGARLNALCVAANLYVVHVRAEGDPVWKLPPLRGKHYEVEVIDLPNDIRGWIKKHMSYGILLRKGEYQWKKYSH